MPPSFGSRGLDRAEQRLWVQVSLKVVALLSTLRLWPPSSLAPGGGRFSAVESIYHGESITRSKRELDLRYLWRADQIR